MDDLVRINVYSKMNPGMQFDISVPLDKLGIIVQAIPIAGEKWYTNPDYYCAGWAEPLTDMLTHMDIPYILHDDLSANAAVEVPFV